MIRMLDFGGGGFFRVLVQGVNNENFQWCVFGRKFDIEVNSDKILLRPYDVVLCFQR